MRQETDRQQRPSRRRKRKRSNARYTTPLVAIATCPSSHTSLPFLSHSTATLTPIPFPHRPLNPPSPAVHAFLHRTGKADIAREKARKRAEDKKEKERLATEKSKEKARERAEDKKEKARLAAEKSEERTKRLAAEKKMKAAGKGGHQEPDGFSASDVDTQKKGSDGDTSFLSHFTFTLHFLPLTLHIPPSDPPL
jgi:hypothetical protein